MSSDREDIINVLRHNSGFDEPELWADYALRHRFKPVQATKITQCPDCDADPSRTLGQFVYYSSLLHLLLCSRCGLIWMDAHIDPHIMDEHFERTYKDDTYFGVHREAIFQHLAAVIDKLAHRGARVLDIGGARGDCMQKVLLRRPDLHVTVQDISKSATRSAATHLNLDVVCGHLHALESRAQQYDLVVLSDVLYYEPQLTSLWSVLSSLIRPEGSILIRIPNKFLFIRLAQLWFDLRHRKAQRKLQDRVRCLNPEHIYIFRRQYLETRLRAFGFNQVYSLPSPLLASSMVRLHEAYFYLASIASALSRRALVLTPSMLVIGSHRHLRHQPA